MASSSSAPKAWRKPVGKGRVFLSGEIFAGFNPGKICPKQKYTRDGAGLSRRDLHDPSLENWGLTGYLIGCRIASKQLLACNLEKEKIVNVQPSTEEFDATQNAILDGVLACISNYGFGGVTTRRIAAAANVNEVTIFRRFGSKNEVIKAAFRREANFVQTEAVYYTGDLVADLHRIVATLWQAAGRRQSILPLLIAEIPRNPELREAAQASLQVIGQVLQIIQQYQADGQLRVEPPLLTFATLIGPIVFINLLGHLQPAEVGTFQAETYVQHFLIGRRASV